MMYPSACWQLRKYVIIVKWYVLVFSSYRLFGIIFYYWNYYNRFTALCTGQPGWDGTRRNIHPLTYPDHYPTFISFFHVLWSIASSLFNLCALQSFCTTSVEVLFGLPLGLKPSTSYCIHFFTQSVSSFRNTCPCHRSLFAVVPRLYHLFLVCLPTLYLRFYLWPWHHTFIWPFLCQNNFLVLFNFWDSSDRKRL